MTECVTLNNKLINIGPWDECVVTTYEIQNPYTDEGDAPEDWDYQVIEIRTVNNPLPEGAINENRTIVESDKGRLLLVEDWEALREDAYPSVEDQLDAFWKGGEIATTMQTKILAIKTRYPKP